MIVARPSLVLVLSLFIGLAAASVESTFKTTCSVPNTTTHFVSSPDTRGTLDILWSCLFTIIACTLTIQHLNVPEQREDRDPGWRGDLKWSTKDTLRSLKWMVITILAPETLVGKGWDDLVSARKMYRKLRDQARKDGVPWTVTHAHFTRMGGFVVRSNQGSASTESVAGVEDRPVKEETAVELGLERNNTLQSHGLAIEESSVAGRDSSFQAPTTKRTSFQSPEPSTSAPPNPYHLTTTDILNLQKHGQLPKLPRFTQEEINDKSKSNAFIKTIAITQILWTVTSILIRTGRKLAVTQLEITVLAFSSCSIIIYCLNWQKPKDVKTPYTLLSFPGDIPDETLRVLRFSCSQSSGSSYYRSNLLLASSLGFNRSMVTAGTPIPNDYSEYDSNVGFNNPQFCFMIGLLFGCAVFGGVHVMAWNFDFPTRIELILWRVASVWCTAFTLLTLVTALAVSVVSEWLKLEGDDWLDETVLAVLVGFYIIGRLILLVEIFRTLLFLPPNAFIATSASNIPHVA